MWFVMMSIVSAYILGLQLSVLEVDDEEASDGDAKGGPPDDGSCLELLSTVLGCLTLKKSDRPHTLPAMVICTSSGVDC